MQRQPGAGTSGRELCEELRLILPCRVLTGVSAKWVHILVKHDLCHVSPFMYLCPFHVPLSASIFWTLLGAG